MVDNCCDSFGGRVVLEIDGVRYKQTQAAIELSPATQEVEAEANQDGSPCYKVKQTLAEADLELRNDCGIDWASITSKCHVNATISEELNGRTHLFTGTRIIGKPQVNVSTGEVKGLKLAGGVYTVRNPTA